MARRQRRNRDEARRVGPQLQRGPSHRGCRQACGRSRDRPGRPPAGSDERRQPQPQRPHDRRRSGGGSRGPGTDCGRGRIRDRYGEPCRGTSPDRGSGRGPIRASRRGHHDRLYRAGANLRGERFSIPVSLYGEAATSPARRRLADVRRGQYEGLRTQIGEAGREPDFGPVKVHATAGAMAVGARPFLIAYNINLDSRDVELAKRIARRIRESSGGLPRVQANGFWIEELGRAQVSMNLLDFRATPLWLVWETVRSEAAADGGRL